jgi:hypothetical protein
MSGGEGGGQGGGNAVFIGRKRCGLVMDRDFRELGAKMPTFKTKLQQIPNS